MLFYCNNRDRIIDTIWGVGRTVSIMNTETIAIPNRRTSRFTVVKFLHQQYSNKQKKRVFFFYLIELSRETGKKNKLKNNDDKKITNKKKGKRQMPSTSSTCVIFRFTPKYLLNFWHCIQLFSGRICYLLCLNYRSKNCLIFVFIFLSTFVAGSFYVYGTVTYQWERREEI